MAWQSSRRHSHSTCPARTTTPYTHTYVGYLYLHLTHTLIRCAKSSTWVFRFASTLRVPTYPVPTHSSTLSLHILHLVDILQYTSYTTAAQTATRRHCNYFFRLANHRHSADTAVAIAKRRLHGPDFSYTYAQKAKRNGGAVLVATATFAVDTKKKKKRHATPSPSLSLRFPTDPTERPYKYVWIYPRRTKRTMLRWYT